VELAYDYVRETALIGLRDLEQNARGGASLAGTWIALVGGLGYGGSSPSLCPAVSIHAVLSPEPRARTKEVGS
jgi:hypothetical protein